MATMTVNGSTSTLNDGVSFRDTVISAARDAGFGKFRVILDGAEIDPAQAPATITGAMSLELRPYDVAGGNAIA